MMTDCSAGGDSGTSGNWSADTTAGNGPTLIVDADDAGGGVAADAPADSADLTMIGASDGDLSAIALFVDGQDFNQTLSSGGPASDALGSSSFVSGDAAHITPDVVTFPEPGAFGIALLTLGVLAARRRPVR
jgi:hypothetical protein